MRGEYRHHFDGTSQVDKKTMIPNIHEARTYALWSSSSISTMNTYQKKKRRMSFMLRSSYKVR